jgi:hypothetical protein
VTGDLADLILNAPAGSCGANSPAILEVVDDVLILVTLEPIDGPGGTLAAAGPCFLRTASYLPVLGLMRFDTDDLAQLEGDGRLGPVIMHEMGHVLGFGGLWGSSYFDLLRNPSCPSSPGVDTHFAGTQAIAAFDFIGGTGYTGGEKVPVENSLGSCPGTRDVHWRESVFDEELMTGFVEVAGTTMPLSRVSVASLGDMGYQVNLAAADAFTKTFGAMAALVQVRAKLDLNDDVWRGPISVVDAQGRILRVIRP